MGYADDLFGSYNLKGINAQLLAEARANAKKAGINRIGITAGMNDHRLMTTSGNVSRHSRGNALDFGSFNGYPVTSKEGAALAAAYAKAAQGTGYTRNRESGNARAVLYGFNDPARGGNHLNHVHVSYRPDLGGNMPQTMTKQPSRTAARLLSTAPSGALQLGGLSAPGPIDFGQQDPAQPAGMTSASIYALAKELLSNKGYDPTAPVETRPWGGESPITYQQPSDLEQAQGLERQAAEGAVTPEQLQRNLLMKQLESQQGYGQQMDAIQTPHEQQVAPPAYPELQLPNAPGLQQPQINDVNPMAGIIAAIGGLVSPQNAGQIGAGALGGALDANQLSYERGQRQYGQNIQQLLQKHRDAIEQRDDQIRTTQYNNRVNYSNSIADTKAAMERAMRNLQTGTTSGAAGVYGAADKQNEPGRKAALSAQHLRETMGIKAGQEAAREKQGQNLLGVAAGLQKSEESNAVKDLVARLNAEARANSAEKGLEGKKYGADKSLEGRQYGADKSLEGANVRAKASVQNAGTRANATVSAAKIRAEAPSKSQSGELKSAQTLHNQALGRLRSFESKFPLDMRMQTGETGNALRTQWTNLNNDVQESQKAIEAARASTPMPSRPIKTKTPTSGVTSSGAKWRIVK